MKRVLSIIILLMILFFGGQWLVTYLKKSHEVDYEYVVDDITFAVKEKYSKALDNQYYFEISSDKGTFTYAVPNLYQKKKKIISDIKVAKNDQMLCIYPIFEKENSTHNIECSMNGVTYGYQAVKNDRFVQEFVEELKKESIMVEAFNGEKQENMKVGQSTVYSSNILENDQIIFYNYRGVDILSLKNNRQLTFFPWDKYENQHGILVDHYYLVPIYRSEKVFDFTTLRVFDITSSNISNIDFPDTVSMSTYINGVEDNKVYYFDKDHMVQYEVNIGNKSVRVVGNESLGGQYYNGKEWETLNIRDFITTEKKFSKSYSNIELLKQENIVEVFESSSAYYYYTNTGEFYRIYKAFDEDATYLFKANNPNNVSLYEDTLYYVVGDTLYYYQENIGQRKILSNNELLYNKLNRVSVYKSEDIEE